MKRMLVLTGVLAVLVCVWSSPARATWSHDPEENSRITGDGDQGACQIASDGAGGAIIVWEDRRAGNGCDIYAQRIDDRGNPLWSVGGLEICGAADDQEDLRVASDGVGGAVIVWEDSRAGVYADVYAQRVDGSGGLLWGVDGVMVASGAGHGSDPDIICDGAGGAYTAWSEDYMVFMQRIGATGNLLWWGQDGLKVGDGPGVHRKPRLVSDGLDGAIIVWESDSVDIRAQRVDPWGGRRWLYDAALCNAYGNQHGLEVIVDGEGGVIVAWEDGRLSPDSDAVYAQRVGADGSVLWADDGIEMGSGARYLNDVRLVSDGDGGAVIAWGVRTGSPEYDYYALVQRVDAGGQALWGDGGIEVCGSTSGHPELVGDGAAGAVVVWTDQRHGSTTDLYGQRFDASGNALWTAEGVALCTASQGQGGHRLVSDGRGGAIASWVDGRDWTVDIYAQRVEQNGYLGYPAPGQTDIVDYPDDQGGVAVLSWLPSYLDAYPNEIVTHYSVWMRMPEDRVPELRDRPSTQHLAAEVGMSMESVQGLVRSGWALVGETPACYWDEYAYHAPTYGDSTEAGVPLTEYMVVAHASDQWTFWESVPRAGYSVDNIAPGAPLGLTAEPIGTGVALAWSPSNEHDEDLSVYRVYRSDISGFTLDGATLVGAAADTFLTDADPGIGTWYYVVVAQDIHDNEGEPSNEATARVDDPSIPMVYALRGNYPNPFNPVTTIEFDLPEPADMTLEVFDVTGRLVRTLVEGHETAGRKQALWDGRDEHGSRVASGVYYCRMAAAGYEKTIKMTLLK